MPADEAPVVLLLLLQGFKLNMQFIEDPNYAKYSCAFIIRKRFHGKCTDSMPLILPVAHFACTSVFALERITFLKEKIVSLYT